MWSTNSALLGAQCEFANAPINSLTDPILPTYLRKGFHCAIGDSNPAFGRGENCGKCYKITASGDSGKGGTPGHAGSATIMASNGGAGGPSHFDCIMDGYKEITGAATGVWEMEFEPVKCDEITGPPVAINWADKNAYYCKMMFENIGGWGGLDAVQLCLNGNQCGNLQRAGGATWTGCPGGTANSVTIKFTQHSPGASLFQLGGEAALNRSETLECSCPGSWPWESGYQCKCQKNFS